MPRYVDIEPIITNIRRNLMPNVDEAGTVTVENAERYFLRLLETAPAADVTKTKHGTWNIDTEYYDDDYSECNVRSVFVCSICSRTERTRQPYCNCGAKMDGE